MRFIFKVLHWLLEWAFKISLVVSVYFSFYVIWIISGDKKYAEDEVINILKEVRQDLLLDEWRDRRENK